MYAEFNARTLWSILKNFEVLFYYFVALMSQSELVLVTYLSILHCWFALNFFQILVRVYTVTTKRGEEKTTQKSNHSHILRVIDVTVLVM